MRVTFNELAERELNDAAHYYELEQAGLGSALITDIQRCTETIVAHPLDGFDRPGHHPASAVPTLPVWTAVYRRRG